MEKNCPGRRAWREGEEEEDGEAEAEAEAAAGAAGVVSTERG
jgi:hypothetical protein